MSKKITSEQIEEFYIRTGLQPVYARALTTFFHGEVELLRDYLNKAGNRFPRLNNLTEDLSIKIYIPIDSTFEFLNKIPDFDLMLKQKRIISAGMNALLSRHPEADQESRRFVRKEEQRADEWERVIESVKKNLPKYLEFIKRVGVGVDKRVSQRRITRLDENEMCDINVRNEIYREALGQESWLLGYDIKLATRFGSMTAQDNEHRADLYKSLDGDAKGLINQKRYVTVNPPPVGIDEIDGETLYEQRIPGETPFEQYQALEQAVEKHFEGRIQQIIK